MVPKDGCPYIQDGMYTHPFSASIDRFCIFWRLHERIFHWDLCYVRLKPFFNRWGFNNYVVNSRRTAVFCEAVFCCCYVNGQIRILQGSVSLVLLQDQFKHFPTRRIIFKHSTGGFKTGFNNTTPQRFCIHPQSCNFQIIPVPSWIRI